MPDAVLTRERILEAAEDVLRRYGPAKANVVDVARALGVSHGSVYRHFSSKAALVDAVVGRWLEAVAVPLAEIADEDDPAPARLVRWLDGLVAAKRARATDEPELFATYVALTAEARDVVRAHVEELIGQLAKIVGDGVASSELAAPDPPVAARAIFQATSRFHNPVNAAEWSAPDIDADYAAVRDLLVTALIGPEAGPDQTHR
jgi:AcrR family transcriptional regulator